MYPNHILLCSVIYIDLLIAFIFRFAFFRCAVADYVREKRNKLSVFVHRSVYYVVEIDCFPFPELCFQGAFLPVARSPNSMNFACLDLFLFRLAHCCKIVAKMGEISLATTTTVKKSKMNGKRREMEGVGLNVHRDSDTIHFNNV